MAFSVVFRGPRVDQGRLGSYFDDAKQVFSGEASYEISPVGVLNITHEQGGKLRVRHFALGHWIEVEDNVDSPE
jgi:hypothetical protein